VKFLHTSDWHVGRTVRGVSRLAEQENALQQVLTHAHEQAVDCLLVAGDVFDTSTPAPESERIVYGFFQELRGLGVPAVVIAGNHDHPQRWDALASLLTSIDVHAIGAPAARRDEATFLIPSRDDKERAFVAALPWIAERAVVTWDALKDEMGAPLMQYAERVGRALEGLSREFRPDTCNVLMSHVFVDGARVGIGGGERDLHLDRNIYGVLPAKLPSGPQYIAMGHVHKPQDIECGTRASYSGSLLQLDFGEHDQAKCVNLVEVHAKLPAGVTRLPITAGREMVDIGSPEKGALLSDLAKYAERNDSSWFRVFIDVDMPVPNLPQLVRETLPSAVHVERARGGDIEPSPSAADRERLGPAELFSRFYASNLGRGREPAPQTVELFRRLMAEEQTAEHEEAPA
jgi:exonuclease SbcD